MFVVGFLVILLWQTNAEPDQVIYRCNNLNTGLTMTFNPSSDSVEGRYTAELCTLKNPNWTDWTIDLNYYDNPKYCNSSVKSWQRKPHSTNTITLNDPNNCSHVCYAMKFDLIFSTCYEVKSNFKGGYHTTSFHNITNNLTKAYFYEKVPKVSLVNHEYYITLMWLLGIPATDFKVQICPHRNGSKSCEHIVDVTSNCSVQEPAQVSCRLALAHGCYTASLEHLAPWTIGLFTAHTHVYFEFCHNAPRLPVPPGGAGGAAAWWAGGAALLAAGALLAGAALHRALHARSYHKRVLDTWRRTRGDVEVAPEAPDRRAVLLLYAREGELAQQALDALRALLEHAAPGMVYDLFSAEVMAQCAAAPASWLRGVLARDDVRVLLLQTPAIAALYHAELQERGGALILRSPLLARRVQSRAPHYGDTLLQHALRYMAETVDAHHHYHKYYIATYAELETEILPQVVPYRRYVLPAAAGALLQDLRGAAPSPPSPRLLRAHTAAALRLAAHAHAHPDYLTDELLLIPT